MMMKDASWFYLIFNKEEKTMIKDSLVEQERPKNVTIIIAPPAGLD